MLIIREEQIQHFIAEDAPSLVRLIRHILRQANPERVKDYPDKLLDNMINIGIERAKSHELTRAEEIAAFVAVMFEIAPNFDTQKDIEQILNNPNFPPDERLQRLWIKIPDTAWQEAEANYDVKIWFPDK